MAKLNTIADDYRTFADLLDVLTDLEAAINAEIKKADQQNRKLFDINRETYCDERDHDIQANLQEKANSLADNYSKIKNSRAIPAKVRKTLAGYDRVFVHKDTNQSGYPEITSLLDKLRKDIGILENILQNR